MGRGQPVNMYQSHQQSSHSYAMSKAPSKISGDFMGEEALARSLNQAFYITNYQSYYHSGILKLQ